MKVLVVNNAAPFIRGGAEELADNLVRELNATPGVQSELMRLPFKWDPAERLIEEMVLHRQLRLWNVDRVIALKFPAYLVPHANKVLWILHQFRQAYDLADVGQGLAAEGPQGQIKAAIRRADEQCFAEAAGIYVNSPTTLDRLRRYNGFDAEVLYPPLNNGELFVGEDPANYVFAGGRVAPAKRQHLLIEAMAQVPGSGRLLIAGPAETVDYAKTLQRLVEDLDLAGRVELNFGFHPRAQIARWVNQAQACAYLPFDEDSLGYVTMEAFAAGKAVLTTTDSGGLLEIVNQDTGRVTEPHPEAIASGLSDLLNQPALAAQLGQAAQAEWRGRGLTWGITIERLLS